MAKHHAFREVHENTTLLQIVATPHRHLMFITFVCLTPIVCLLFPGQVEVHQGPKL